jgi:hypothetical protein
MVADNVRPGTGGKISPFGPRRLHFVSLAT